MMEPEETPAPTPGISSLKSQASALACMVIWNQPQSFFKYRYESEMISSHGYVYSATYEQSTDKKNTHKTYPGVMLENYDFSLGNVIIRASLVQEKSNDDHPNILAPNGIIEMEVSNNIASFEKLCIQSIKTEALRKKYPDLNIQEIKMLKKRINMDSVRIKFSAICSVTKKEICSPVYSNPIYNKRTQNKQDMKILDMSLFRCSANGGERCVMITSQFAKANSKTGDIRVRFYTETSEGQISWEVDAKIENIYQNRGLTITIPAYKDVNIRQMVSAYVQLVRPSDGAVGEPRVFEYVPNCLLKHQMTKCDTNNNSTLTPPMTPGRACEPIMQEVAEQLRQESDERHCPGIQQQWQGIIPDQILEEEINQTTNQIYETQNLTQNVEPLPTERDACLYEADGQRSPARQQFVKEFGQDNFDEIPLHTLLEDQASVNATEPQRDRREDLRNFLDDMRVRINIQTSERQLFWERDAHIEDIIQNYARTIRTAYEYENIHVQWVYVQWVRSSDGAAVSEPLNAPYRLVNQQMSNVTPGRAREPITQGTEPLSETGVTLNGFLEADLASYLRLWTESEDGGNTQRSNSSEGTFDNSTTAAQVREEFSDGPAPKKNKK